MPFNRLNHTTLGEIRPRFALKIDSEPEKAMDYLEQRLRSDLSVAGMRANQQLLFLKTPLNLQHYWSPEMTVRIDKNEYTGETTVNCLIGPRQSVWAMFALVYAAIVLITSFGGMFGIVQYMTSGASLWIWLIPVGIVIFSSVFLTSKIGQKKGRDQMLHLVSFVYHALNEIGTVERVSR
jgi:hypothetical protein